MYLPLQGEVDRLMPPVKVAISHTYGVKMSDEKDDKKKTGFAANPNGINRRGRPVGSKNKLPTDPQIKELLKKNAPEAVQTLITLMRNGSEGTKLKAAFKLVDMTYTVMLNDEKLNGPSGKTEEKPEETEKPESKGVVIHMTQQ